MGELNTTTEVVTIEEARRRLATVRPTVERIMKLARTDQDLRRRQTAVAPAKMSAADRKAIEAERVKVRDAIRAAIEELNAQGALLKDAERGLIDFYGWRGTDMVFLCWLHGEETIHSWHGIHDGFSGRQRIDEAEIA